VECLSGRVEVRGAQLLESRVMHGQFNRMYSYLLLRAE
jgi:hypothetical protein